VARGGSSDTNPLSKVIDLLGGLVSKIEKDGEAEAKAYREYFEWCDDTSKNAKFAITTAQGEKEELEAKIGELSSDIAVATSKIEELAAAISTGENELNAATAIRKKEAADVAASEAELVEAIDTLGRAISVLEREMAKHPAAFAQLDTKSATTALQALSAVLDAASFPGKDQAKLIAFVQSRQAQEGDEAQEDQDMGAPAAAQYKTHSGSIVDTLEDLREKAEGQLADLRKAETNAKHNFEMVRQSLTDQAAADSKDLANEKASKAGAEEAKATAESDLGVAVKALESNRQQLATAQSTCVQVAADHEATVAGRKEELEALAKAIKTLQETTSGASAQSYSFIQISTGSLAGLALRTRSDLAGSEVVMAVKKLAKQQHSAALAQLASRIATTLRYGSGGKDVFAKVKGLIQDMIAKLEAEAGSEATEKAYCDEQMAKTEAKKGELEDDIAKMTSKIDKASARSARLKDQIQALQSELAALAKDQAEMDKIRQETHADYVSAKADLEEGLGGVRRAVDILRDYYGAASLLQDSPSQDSLMQQPAMPETHEKSVGAGGSIISMLEVVESDFATNLAKEETAEADAQSKYEKVSQENAITKTLKEQDVKYKSQEAGSMDATKAEYSGDRETASTELSAVEDYYSKIKARCIAKPETYEARKARRLAEIEGLKNALSILEDETAFVQHRQRRHQRGFLGAAQQ